MAIPATELSSKEARDEHTQTGRLENQFTALSPPWLSSFV